MEMETFTHSCIKCQTSYTDADPDPYYCASCEAQKKVIAAEVDMKLSNIHSARQAASRFSSKDFVGVNGRIFFNAKDI